MSFRVTVKPSEHVFTVEARESILHAGLRAGLNLDYSCANGSCGQCRARLISGTLASIQHADHPLAPAEQQQGWFLMCCHRPDSDLLLEAHESGAAVEIPTQRLKARVAKVEQLQEEVVLLQLRTPRSQGLRFLAGQSVRLRFDGLAHERILPIASCPCDGLHLRFHLRRQPGDPFSAFVFDRLTKGREVALTGPCGDFTLDENSDRPLLLLAWESGFAHLESLVDHAIQLDPERSMHLYWLSGYPGGHYLSNYCRAWVDALDDFHYHSVDLAPAGADAAEPVLREIAARHGPLADWDAYLALPSGLAELAAGILGEAGLPMAQRHLIRVQFP